MPGPLGDAGDTCPHCGSGLPSHIRFCTACGNAVDFRAGLPRPVAVEADPVGTVTAGPGVRAAAFSLDVAAMITPALPLSMVGALLGMPEVIVVVIPVAFTSVWIWMQIWAGLTGKTVGKVLLGLRVVREHDCGAPGFGPAAIRGLIFAGTLGAAALPALSGTAGVRTGLHDRLSGLTVLDVTVGDNPLGSRPQTLLRRAPGRSVNRVESPIPVAARRRI